MDENAKREVVNALAGLCVCAQELRGPRPGRRTNVVVFGGAALAANGVREQFRDLDVYIDERDETLQRLSGSAELPRRLASHGVPAYEVDVAPDDYLFGQIRIPDLTGAGGSRELSVMDRSGERFVLRSLNNASLVIQRLCSPREKDRQSVGELVARVPLRDVIRRARKVCAENPEEVVRFHLPDLMAESLLAYPGFAQDPARYALGVRMWLNGMGLQGEDRLEIAESFGLVDGAAPGDGRVSPWPAEAVVEPADGGLGF